MFDRVPSSKSFSKNKIFKPNGMFTMLKRLSLFANQQTTTSYMPHVTCELISNLEFLQEKYSFHKLLTYTSKSI